MRPAHSAVHPEIKFYYVSIVPIRPRLQGGAFPAHALKAPRHGRQALPVPIANRKTKVMGKIFFYSFTLEMTITMVDNFCLKTSPLWCIISRKPEKTVTVNSFILSIV